MQWAELPTPSGLPQYDPGTKNVVVRGLAVIPDEDGSLDGCFFLRIKNQYHGSLLQQRICLENCPPTASNRGRLPKQNDLSNLYARGRICILASSVSATSALNFKVPTSKTNKHFCQTLEYQPRGLHQLLSPTSNKLITHVHP